MIDLSPLIKDLAVHLKQKQWQLVTAESCTGGLLSAQLTELPGSSDWFERGFVTYSNLAKQELLAVPAELLTDFGAVSEEVAQAMALGALQHSQAELSVAVTGIAGPGGGTPQKPVGTVCFAWASQVKVRAVKKHFLGDRQQVRWEACREAIVGLLPFFSTP